MVRNIKITSVPDIIDNIFSKLTIALTILDNDL